MSMQLLAVMNIPCDIFLPVVQHCSKHSCATSSTLHLQVLKEPVELVFS